MKKKPEPEWINQTEFAKRVNVSQPRIALLLRDGRLRGATKKDGKRIMINYEKAKSLLETRIDPMNPGKIREAINTLSPDEKKTAVKAAGVGQGIDYTQARTLNERYKAALKKLEFDEKNGSLVRADEVKQEAFDCARRTRDAILNIPDRVAAMLASENKESAVRELLAAELRTALEELKRRPA